MATLREMLGQMFMVGIPSTELGAEESRILANYYIGGLILFRHNLDNPRQISQLCRDLWKQKHAALGPFIAIDQEGGRVHRLPEPFTHFPAAAVLGGARSKELAYRAGLAMAREQAAVGINLNLAPVLDVLSNPANPVIGDRSLGSDPDEVAGLGWGVVEGLRDGAIIPCGKHFPGHGDTVQDSHLELPVVTQAVDALRRVGLAPFAHACRNGIECLMTAHVLYRTLDQEHPATLSRAIITGLLRGELGYQGVVASDDMEMKAISGRYGPEEAALLAVEAGVDLLLYGHDLEAVVAAWESLIRSAERDPRTRGRVAESFARIEKLKQRRLGSFAPEAYSDRAANFRPGRQIAAEITEAYKRYSR
jgi:beta-N-acetylhexosaminidase